MPLAHPLLWLAAGLALLPVPAPVSEPASRTDAYGDPLPPQARLRLGSVRLRHGHFVIAVAFAPDGRTVASGSRDGTIRLWDTATGKEQFTLSGHKDGVNCMAFSPDGKTLAS